MEINWSQVFEATMLICFGFSWPFNIRKTLRQRSSAGKSFMFLTLILIGYIAGVISKLLSVPNFTTFLWALNGVMVGTDLALSLYYHHNPGGRAAKAAAATASAAASAPENEVRP